MLANIRNKSKGWVAYLIVGLITIPFALAGISQYLTGEQNIIVAVVDGEEINKNEYLKIFNQQKRNLQEQFGDNYTETINNNLKKTVIESLINNKILTQFANELGIATINHEIKDDILSNQNFFKNGKFSIEKYQTILRLNGYTTTMYENLIINDKNSLQIKNNLLSSEFLTEFEQKQLNDLLNQERKIAYIILNNNDFAKQAKVSDTEIKNFFDKNNANFFNPRKVKIDFIELSIESLLKNIVVDDKKLQTFFTENKEQYTTNETRKASHILIENQTKASDILTEIKAGGDFAKLAKKYSIDTGSSSQGGDLGFFGKGAMVPEFELSVFSMQIGEISKLIKSKFGYHIIKLVEIKESKIQEFATVKKEITTEFKKLEAQKQIFDLGEHIQTLAYDGSLEDIVDELNLTLITTDLFDESSNKFDKKFIQASFSNEILNKDENKVIEISSDKIIALRKNQFIASSQQTLSQAEKIIEKKLLSEKVEKITQKKAEKIVTNKAGSFSDEKWINRTNSSLTQEIVKFAFTMSLTNSLPNYQYKTLNDKSIIVKLIDSKITKKENNLNLLVKAYNDEIFNDILKYLKTQTTIKIFNNQL